MPPGLPGSAPPHGCPAALGRCPQLPAPPPPPAPDPRKPGRGASLPFKTFKLCCWRWVLLIRSLNVPKRGVGAAPARSGAVPRPTPGCRGPRSTQFVFLGAGDALLFAEGRVCREPISSVHPPYDRVPAGAIPRATVLARPARPCNLAWAPRQNIVSTSNTTGLRMKAALLPFDVHVTLLGKEGHAAACRHVSRAQYTTRLG